VRQNKIVSKRLIGERTRCESCNAPIFWMETTNGKLMPVDTKAERRLVMVLNADTLILAGQDDADHIRMRSVPTFISHFATCPDADAWRRRR
jgi:hypothetical protein